MPDRKKEYTDRVKVVMASMHDKSTHEDIYRIMDALGEEAMPSLVNLTQKIDKMAKRIYGLQKQNENLKAKTQRIWR